jgi:hypothetical protein
MSQRLRHGRGAFHSTQVAPVEGRESVSNQRTAVERKCWSGHSSVRHRQRSVPRSLRSRYSKAVRESNDFCPTSPVFDRGDGGPHVLLSQKALLLPAYLSGCWQSSFLYLSWLAVFAPTSQVVGSRNRMLTISNLFIKRCTTTLTNAGTRWSVASNVTTTSSPA